MGCGLGAEKGPRPEWAAAGPDGGAAQKSAAAVPNEAEDLRALELFPMYTVSMRTFLDLEGMEAFETLRKLGTVHPAASDAVIHFISHEWLGFRHPDPQGMQLRRMKDIFRKVCAGHGADLFTPTDWTAFAQRVSTGSSGAYRSSEGALLRNMAGGALTEELFQEHTAGGEVWLDYGSIPQVLGGPSKADAIKSIPAYLERSQYFWVLAPPARHGDTGKWCNFATWRSRGWCRLEEWGNFLRSQPCAPLIITHNEKLTIVGFADFINSCQGKPHLAPCNGAFSCCRIGHEILLPTGERHDVPCDKHFLLPVLLKMYNVKRKHLRGSDSGNFWHSQYIAKVEPMIFGGAPSQPLPPLVQDGQSLMDFLHRFGFTSLAESPAPGFSVWNYAAMAGHIPTLRMLQDEKEVLHFCKDPQHRMTILACAAQQGHVTAMQYLWDEGLADSDTVLAQTGLGISALDRAAKGGFPEAVSFLLDFRADIEVRRKDGATPLHGAASSGHAACCQVLLQRRAQVDAIDAGGRSPIHLAADPVTLYGDAEGKLAALEELLKYRGDPLLEDNAGESALNTAWVSSFCAAEDILRAAVLDRDAFCSLSLRVEV